MQDSVQQAISNYPVHESMRGRFGFELFKAMASDERVWLILPDLGYKMFDEHLKHFPDRAMVVGASEQAAVGICVGLALQGKIPFCYSITPFLLYRPFEWLRNYLHHEKIPVKLVGSGLDDDYKHDGFTHDASDALDILGCLRNIMPYIPGSPEAIPAMMNDILSHKEPAFIALRR